MTAQQIKKARHKLKLTQEEFAERVGVSRKTVNRWEKGHDGPSKVCLKMMDIVMRRPQ